VIEYLNNRVRCHTVVLAILMVVMIAPASAIEKFVIKDIRAQGLQRISAGTVFNYLPLKVGDTVTTESLSAAIRALYKTGFFRDVSLQREGQVLVVKVIERPAVAQIDFIGNKEFDDKILNKVFKRLDIVAGRVFSQSSLNTALQALKNQYFSRGKYAVKLRPTITPLERNRVSITLEIDEGDVVLIKRIHLIGNKTYSEDKLKGLFELKATTAFMFFSKRDRYSKQKLSADLEALRSFYQNNGYQEFRIESTEVSISADRKAMFVDIAIHEGAHYQFGSIKIRGKTEVSKQELRKLVNFAPGDVYSLKRVSETRAALASKLADAGYAFANINAIPELQKDKKRVDFVFVVDPGRRVYVRKIHVRGNITTRDDVIRREMRQLEGAWFSASKVRRSRVRLERLGFFDKIDIQTPSVPGTVDQIDIDVEVKERPTGSLTLGVGYSDADGPLIQASVSQKNLFGTGKQLDLSVDNSSTTKHFGIRYTNPYYTLSGVSRTFFANARKVDSTSTATADYIADTYALGMAFQIPVTEFNSINLGLSVERVNLNSTSETPPEILNFITLYPQNNDYKLTLSYSRDTRNRAFFPSAGSLHRISLESTLPGSDLEYYKLGIHSSWFWSISKRITFNAFGDIGYGDGYGKQDSLPFFKNYYAGGSSTVRGYDSRSLGPQDSGTTPAALGGSKRMLAGLELFFPFPGSDINNDKRLALFVDSGMVYGDLESIDFGALRYSTGVAFKWFSPMGPLSISYGVPLNDKPNDRIQKVQFTLGTLFK